MAARNLLTRAVRIRACHLKESGWMHKGENQLEAVTRAKNGGKSAGEDCGCGASKNGFQAGQTAKARQGPPCAVTPLRTSPPAPQLPKEYLPRAAHQNREKPVTSTVSGPASTTGYCTSETRQRRTAS